jgi:mitochondrial fission protein ELM1
MKARVNQHLESSVNDHRRKRALFLCSPCTKRTPEVNLETRRTNPNHVTRVHLLHPRASPAVYDVFVAEFAERRFECCSARFSFASLVRCALSLT